MPFQSRLHGQDFLFQQIRDSLKELPHFFITGPPGCGKTTFLEDFIELCKKEAPFEIESVLWLSSEKDRGIHTIRDKVNDFCKRAHKRPNMLRWIIVDDADTLPLISQQALRRPMEQFSHLTRFIFASRQASSLIEPLRSRCLTLQLEPISPYDAIPFYFQQYNIPKENQTETLVQFCIQHFTSIHEMKCILRLYKAFLLKGNSTEESFEKLKVLLPLSHNYKSDLLTALGKNDEVNIRISITNLYLNGYLLDDILLEIEKGIRIFPNIDPDIRFRILQFTMLGWISIQQGKEHWLDTMDIVQSILQSPSYTL
jgi:DNA polymerase III delta prime subunit